MRYVGWMARQRPLRERYWRAGVYVAVYNTAAAEVIWQNWSCEAVLRHGLELEPWIKANWAGLPLRRERRAVRTSAKLAECLRSYAQFMTEQLPELVEVSRGGSTPAERFDSYEAFWRGSSRIRGFGRYATFKLLEFYRRYCDAAIAMPDIRPSGGWSPRETLALLYPEWAREIAPQQNSPWSLRLSQRLADDVLNKLGAMEDLALDQYLLEVFLCDYRQSVEGKRQYPGRSNDSELEYHAKVQAHFGEQGTQLFEAREALTPEACRGELRGWGGVRKELGAVLFDHGYTWSDLIYDYKRTTDLARPARSDISEDIHRRALGNLATG